MKFYKVRYGDWGAKAANREQTVEWTTTLRKAEKIAKDNNDGDYLSTITEIEIPTDKVGLLEFLNREVWR